MDGTTSKLEVPEFPDFKPDIEKLSKSIERLEKKVTDIKQLRVTNLCLLTLLGSSNMNVQVASVLSDQKHHLE